MSALDNAVSLGMVTVSQTGGGYVVRGAEADLLVIDELEQMGAVWRDGDRAYFVATSNAAGRMDSLRRNTNAAAASLAARQALAREQGVKLFDNQRERQQRKVTREISAVYDQAMKEHEAEINRISELLSQDRPPDVDPKEWAAITARRKNTLAELESVYDGLSEGLANAGASAQRLMNGQLAESAAISRNVAAWQLDNMSGVNVSRFLAHDQAALALTGVTSYHGKYDLKAWQGVADKRKARETIKKAVARGLLTGEHPNKIAGRIKGIYTGSEAGSPYKRAVRIARTETARVMSEATVETFRVANEKGVKVRNRWDATLDGKTRDSHRKVDGEIREVGERFSNGLRRVGDGGAADSINCRCCMTPVLDGFEPDSPVRRNNETGELMPYMTYEQWEKSRGGGVVTETIRSKKPKLSPKKPEREYKPVKTAKEAETFASEFVSGEGFGSVGLSYAGVHVDVANEINGALNKFFATFNIPKLQGLAAPAKNTNLGKQVNAHAAYSPIRKSLLLNRNNTKSAGVLLNAVLEDKKVVSEWLEHPERFNFEKMPKRVQNVLDHSKQSGRGLVAESVEEAIFHELGHHLENSLTKEQMGILKESMAKYADGVSGYAADSVGEYIAESTAAFMKGETIKDPALIEIFEGLMK